MQLAQYQKGCKFASVGHRVFGYAMDKVNPSKQTLMNAVITLATNVTMLCCPQAICYSVGQRVYMGLFFGGGSGLCMWLQDAS